MIEAMLKYNLYTGVLAILCAVMSVSTIIAASLYILFLFNKFRSVIPFYFLLFSIIATIFFIACEYHYHYVIG
jgi:hypothetical protein